MLFYTSPHPEMHSIQSHPYTYNTTVPLPSLTCYFHHQHQHQHQHCHHNQNHQHNDQSRKPPVSEVLHDGNRLCQHQPINFKAGNLRQIIIKITTLIISTIILSTNVTVRSFDHTHQEAPVSLGSLFLNNLYVRHCCPILIPC